MYVFVLQAIALSFVFALLIDLIAKYVGVRDVGLGDVKPQSLCWAIIRMYTPLISAAVILGFRGLSPLDYVLSIFSVDGRALIIYLASPLLVLAGLGFSIWLSRLFSRFEVVRAQVTEGSSSLSVLDAVTKAGAKVPLWALLLLGYAVGITVNAVVAFGEESLWRGVIVAGYLTGEAMGIAVIGVAWGLWHASAIALLNYNVVSKEHIYSKETFTLTYTLFTLTLSAVLYEVTVIANSVLPAAAIHGTINALWPLALAHSRSVKQEVGPLGISGALTWIIIYAFLKALFKLI